MQKRYGEAAVERLNAERMARTKVSVEQLQQTLALYRRM
jgi:hypothetical protein